MATRTREKGAARAENRDKRPQAHAKHIRLSSRKAKIVLDLIRGKNVVLSSAIANAVNNQDLDRSTLYVAECYANPGPTLKRYVARSRGSASPMLKRTCHISVVLDQKK